MLPHMFVFFLCKKFVFSSVRDISDRPRFGRVPSYFFFVNGSSTRVYFSVNPYPSRAQLSQCSHAEPFSPETTFSDNPPRRCPFPNGVMVNNVPGCMANVSLHGNILDSYFQAANQCLKLVILRNEELVKHFFFEK